eukprot:2145164-Pyramimonas_sp.AAC.1
MLKLKKRPAGKKPAAADHGSESDGSALRMGDVGKIAAALAPHVTDINSIMYGTDLNSSKIRRDRFNAGLMLDMVAILDMKYSGFQPTAMRKAFKKIANDKDLGVDKSEMNEWTATMDKRVRTMLRHHKQLMTSKPKWFRRLMKIACGEESSKSDTGDDEGEGGEAAEQGEEEYPKVKDSCVDPDEPPTTGPKDTKNTEGAKGSKGTKDTKNTEGAGSTSKGAEAWAFLRAPFQASPPGSRVDLR